MIVKPVVIPGAVHTGVLGYGCAVAEYYTSQPAPTQWLAIGVVSIHSEDRRGGRAKQLLVGTGRTESTAVGSLWDRLTTLPSAQPPMTGQTVRVPATEHETRQPDGPEDEPFPGLVPAEPALQLG